MEPRGNRRCYQPQLPIRCPHFSRVSMESRGRWCPRGHAPVLLRTAVSMESRGEQALPGAGSYGSNDVTGYVSMEPSGRRWYHGHTRLFMVTSASFNGVWWEQALPMDRLCELLSPAIEFQWSPEGTSLIADDPASRVSMESGGNRRCQY